MVKDAADKLTMLLPIRMALNILEESSVILRTIWAFLLPSSARLRIRIRFTVVSAVSADEKNAERANKIIRIINCATTLESTGKHHSFLKIVFHQYTASAGILQESLEFEKHLV